MTRPTTVPSDATPIYPGQSYGPGLGVQTATILTIAAQISATNLANDQHYVRALKDWLTNAQIYAGYGLPIPPAPAKAVHTILHTVYADAGGNVVDSPLGADGLHYAWIWETAG